MADKFRTQDDPLTGVVSYQLSLPSALWFAAELSDLIADMTDADNWEQVGTVTVDEAVQAALVTYRSFATMIGQIFPYITSSPPENTLPCDGSVYNRVDYPDLYAALASAFILSADTFAVPDLRGKTIIGVSTSHATGSTGGEETHELITDELPAHSHSDSGHTHSTGNSFTGAAVMPGEGPVLIPNPIPASTGSASANIGNTGGGTAHNNMQPYVALQYCVVAR